MKIMVKALLIGYLLVLLSGCATLNEDECMTADWYEIGYSDGTKGQPYNYVEKHRKACSKHGVRANFDDWQAGHQAGLRRYCTAEKGYEEGLNNRTYHGVCEGRAAEQFLQGYEQGQQLYHQRTLVSDLERDIEQTSEDIVALEGEWSAIRRELLNDDLTAAERAELINQLERNKEQSENLRIRRDRLDDDLHRAQYDLDMMERGDYRY